MIKIKKCPFCGGEANLFRNFGRGSRGECYWIRVECECCECKTKGFPNNKNEKDENFWKDASIMKALSVWNRRCR